ncbi:Zinc finger protein Dzip1, partial [Nibea albiflora]
QPFHDGVYYPYSSDTQGTHSSAGIPSLLNSPLSQQSANGHPVPAPGMTPSSGASVVLPFKFRPRRESVDWRRINAVDIDMVRCQSPVDPALVKLLQLAQLTVEWLLHCQEFLTLNLRAAEERLAAAGAEREQLQAQQKKQEEKAKALTAELKQRKKVIRTQQSLLTPRIISSQKCPQCDKSFINSSFLQNHMQRRHPDEYDNQLRSDNEKKSQIESLKLEINSLKAQIAQQQQDLQAKAAQEKEQQSIHKDLLREMDRFKAEEMARMDRKIEDSRDGIRREMEFLYTRNIQALNEANQNQTAKHEKSVSPVHSQPERDVDNYKEMQIQAIQKLEHQMKKQDKKWEARLQEIKAQHESEKNQLLNELSRMQSSASDQQDRSQRLQQEMGRRLQEKEQTIKAQREQIRNISSNPPTKVVEVPVIVSAPAPEPKAKRVVLDSSSFSERRPAVEKKPEPAPERKTRVTSSVLRRNNSIKKDMRPDIEQAVMLKLENLGVKPVGSQNAIKCSLTQTIFLKPPCSSAQDQSGLKNKEFTSLLAKVHSNRESFARGKPDYWHQREEIASTMEQKLGVLQIRPRSSSLPSRATQVTSAVRQPKTPQPAPRTKTSTQPKTSTPSSKSALRNFTPK